jgi:hypothetical protein
MESSRHSRVALLSVFISTLGHHLCGNCGVEIAVAALERLRDFMSEDVTEYKSIKRRVQGPRGGCPPGRPIQLLAQCAKQATNHLCRGGCGASRKHVVLFRQAEIVFG